MTKISRQISPEIFDQIYSFVNKQNMLSWQKKYSSEYWNCEFPKRRPQRRSAAGLLSALDGWEDTDLVNSSPLNSSPLVQENTPIPVRCCLLPAFRVRTVYTFVLGHVTESWPDCCHFDKQEIHFQVGKKISFIEK